MMKNHGLTEEKIKKATQSALSEMDRWFEDHKYSTIRDPYGHVKGDATLMVSQFSPLLIDIIEEKEEDLSVTDVVKMIREVRNNRVARLRLAYEGNTTSAHGKSVGQAVSHLAKVGLEKLAQELDFPLEPASEEEITALVEEIRQRYEEPSSNPYEKDEGSKDINKETFIAKTEQVIAEEAQRLAQHNLYHPTNRTFEADIKKLEQQASVWANSYDSAHDPEKFIEVKEAELIKRTWNPTTLLFYNMLNNLRDALELPRHVHGYERS